MPKVSIIVPVYNAGIYLKGCLDSILQQTLCDIEVILILDCPTDGSDVICQKYAEKDNRIRIIWNEKNLHIGLSRNKGLEIATGEYIAFSDNDDYRELCMYEKLYEAAKKENADMVIGVTVNEEEGKRHIFNYPSMLDVKLREFVISDLIACGGVRDDYPLCINIHPHLYRRSLIEEKNIRFVDTKKIAPEDRLFNINFLLHANNVTLVSTPLYYHRMLLTSEAHNKSYMESSRFIAYIDTVYSLLITNNVWDIYQNDFVMGAGKNLINISTTEFFGVFSLKRLHRLLSNLKRKPYIKHVFQHYDLPLSNVFYHRIFEKLVISYLK